MYSALSARELAVLQNMLYTATERTYRLANLARDSEGRLGTYRPVHGEVARLFLEAGQELLDRLDNKHEMTVARRFGHMVWHCPPDVDLARLS